MRKRLIQVFGFLISTLGWLFVLCTMAMDYWRIVQLGGQGGSWIIKAAWVWSNLWKDCYTDTTAVTNCRDYPVLWSVTVYVQGVRGLLMCGLTLGFFGAIFAFLGMECTYIGGAEGTKDKLLLAAAVFHFVGGIADIAGYCLYINRVARSTFAATLQPGTLRYDLGTPIFLGLVGAFFILLGAVLYAVTVFRVIIPKRTVVYAYAPRTYMAPRTAGRTYSGGYYKPGGRTYTTGYYKPPYTSRQYGSYILGSGGSSSSKISKLSQTTPERMSERDAFV